jgi:hypothetical protein
MFALISVAINLRENDLELSYRGYVLYYAAIALNCPLYNELLVKDKVTP